MARKNQRHCQATASTMDAQEPLPPPMPGAEVEEYVAKNILLTGGAGFIGTHVAKRLVERYPEYKVVVLDAMDTCASMQNLELMRPCNNFKFVKGDLQSFDLVSAILKMEEIDTVMHFAAQSHVDNSFGNSLTFTVNNVYATHTLLEACRKYGKIKRFVNVSTDEVYGEQSFHAKTQLNESSQLQPTNPYSAAKAGAEMVAHAYRTSYGIPIITTRGNNVYGPQQFPEKLIPKFCLLARRGGKLPIHGDGMMRRSYLFVEDVAEAFDVILHRGVTGEIYNIGTEKERTVLDVAKDICKEFNVDSEGIITHVEDRKFNDRRYFISDEKLQQLGWRERTAWAEGLKKTVSWYCKFGHIWWAHTDVNSVLEPHPRAKHALFVKSINMASHVKKAES